MHSLIWLLGGFRSQENTLQSFAHLRMYWFRSSDLGNITVTTWTYQPPSPLAFLLIPKCYKAISFPISSSCKKLFTGTYWQASSIQCLDGAQVVEWTGVDQKEWHEGSSEGEVIGLASPIGWECWERFDARDFLGSMFGDWIYMNLSCIIPLYHVIPCLHFNPASLSHWRPHFEVR